MKRAVLPEDFAALAPDMTVSEAARLWDVSRTKARRWYASAGIAPAKPDLHREGYRHSGDTPEQVNVCLNCTRARCPGSCEKMKRRNY